MTIKTIKIIRVVRKSVFAGAVHVTDENIKEVAAWCKSEIRIDPDTKQPYIKVRVQHPLNARQTKAYSGDVVLQTAKGFKTFTNEAFEKNFDLVTSEAESKNEEVITTLVDESKKVRHSRKAQKEQPVYPNGNCPECSLGLMEDKTCDNPECESNHDY